MSAAPTAMTVAPTRHGLSTVEPWRSDRRVPLLGALMAVLVGVGVGLGYAEYVLVGTLALVMAMVSFWTDRGILYVLTLVPFGEALSVGPVTVGRLLAVVSVMVLAVKIATGRLRVPALRATTWVPAAALVAVIVASGLVATNFHGWTFAMGQVALAVAFYLAFAFLIDRPEQIAGLLRVYVVGAVAAAAIGVYQVLTTDRAVGLQGDANIYALYQVAALPAALALAKLSTGGRRMLWLLTILPLLASVGASQSRGALLALGATVLVLALQHPRRRILTPLVALGGVVAYLVVPLLDDRYAVQRVSADRASGRLDIWFTAWHAFLEHPWTGIGAGNFVSQSIERLTTEPGVELIKSHLLTGEGIEVHNIYLESLAERGVFGLATLAAFLGCTLWVLVQAARRYGHPAVTALTPMLVSYCAAAFFLSVSNSKLLWMLAGLGAALLSRPSVSRLPDQPSRLAPRSSS